MKPDIKTAAKKCVKTIETAGIITGKAKKVTVKTKQEVGQTVKTNADTPEQYTAKRFQNTAHSTVTDTAYYFNKAGKKSALETKKNIQSAQITLEEIKAKRAERKAKSKAKQNPASTNEIAKNPAESIFNTPPEKAVHTKSKTAKNAPKTKSIQTNADNHSAVKNTEKTIKSANPTPVKNPFKTAVKAADTATTKSTNAAMSNAKKASMSNRLAVNKFAEKSKKAAEHTKAAAKSAAKFVKSGVKATAKAVKAAYQAAKSLTAAMIAGGWISVLVIIIVSLVGALAGSFYGIFFSTETSETGMNISSVIREINADYDNRIDALKSQEYDSVEISGNKANWKDVLSVYAVKTTTDPDNPMEIATVDDNKKSILSNIFWDMNSIASKIEERTQINEIVSTDDDGNEVITEEEVVTRVLVITVGSKNADDMASAYSFDDKQKGYLAELMSDSNNELWVSIIYNFSGSIDISSLDFENETVNDTQKKIVAVAANSESYGISAKSGYCQAWVADVYQVVTGERGSAHCALCAAESWAVSSDWSEIQVGATVYGYAGNPYGHVGIYIGNGQVIHNLSGEVTVQSLESWVTQFNGFAWGWENNKNLAGET